MPKNDGENCNMLNMFIDVYIGGMRMLHTNYKWNVLNHYTVHCANSPKSWNLKA